MIGTVMQAAGDPPQGEISFKLRDALLAAPGRPPKVLPVEALRAGTEDVWFSASDVHNLCPRMYALAVQQGVPIKGAVDTDLLWTFGVGTGFHHAMQGELLPTLGPVQQGGWKRERQDGTVERVPGLTAGPWTEAGRGWGPRPPGDWWEFVEPKGRIPEVRLVGKWDGVLVWPDSAPEVLEIKTIREDLFATVNPLAGGRPKADHVLQCHAYLWMSGLDRARIVYIAKGSGELRNVTAEHLIVRDEAAIRTLDALLRECHAALHAALAGAPLPDRPAICRIKSDPRARRCDCRDACFPPKPKKEKPAKDAEQAA